MKLRVNIYEHWKGEKPLFGFEWSLLSCVPCPFNRKHCKTGFRLYFGHPTKHLNVSWTDDLFYCPRKKSTEYED